MPPSTSQSIGQTEVSPAPSSSNATVTIGTRYDENQRQEQIHAGRNHSPITSTTREHQQLFQTSPSANFPALSAYAATTAATHGISNSSTTASPITTGSSANITSTNKASHTQTSTTTATTTTTSPHLLHFAKGEGVKEPLPTDVICGRGKMTASHPANRRFRELVDSHKASYQNSKRRDEKTRITCELVDKLRAEGR